ncbi:MAG: CocE/NonD family hydrolase [Alphaproteobacteria bacterium]|nr:CocE/NonD family hydrolase [Alphaproteobacteria bacterium]
MRIWLRSALGGASVAALLAVTGCQTALAQAGPKAAPQSAAAASTVRGGKPTQLAPGAREVMAEMRDGVKLAGNLYLPAGKGPFPCIVTRTPYGKDAMYKDPRGAERYTKEGFAYLVQDVRGKGNSQGFYQAFINDRDDGYDTVEWMAKQSWCNGKVGITGPSAMGITGNLAAISNPPHLTAAFVIVAPTSLTAASFIGGAFKDKDVGGWSRDQGISEDVIAKNAAGYVASAEQAALDIQRNADFIDIPIYNLGGWYDIFNEGNTRNFMYLQHHGAKGARGNQKLEMGPFGHGELSGDMEYPDGGGLGGNPQEIRWFDYWLKGEDNGIMSEPPVKAYMMAGARKGNVSPKNHWMYFGDWPPAPDITKYYFHSDGSLSTKPPTAEEAAKTYTFDPKNPVPTIGGANLTFARGPMDQRPIGNRQDYLRFQTPVLDHDVTIAGEVFADLWAATDGPDTDFMVKLVDVYPDGYEAIVLDSALRTRYRNGRMADQVKMMTPNAPEKLKVDLWDTMITFEKGHRIEVAITSSNAPRFDVNPNTGANPGPNVKTRVARNSVFMDASMPSAIDLPVLVLPQ